MLQRIQSLFLGLAALLMGILLVVNIWDKVSGAEHVSLSAFRMVYSVNGEEKQTVFTFAIAILGVISSTLSLVSLFTYKNRLRQMLFGLINTLLIGATLGLIIYYSMEGEKMIAMSTKGSFGPGMIIPAIALVCNMLANRFIRKDENTVRSADRMR